MNIAILGGSFNPTGVHHLKIVQEVLALDYFDKLIIFPCGPRPDKESTNDIEPIYRAAMLGITFRHLAGKIETCLDDFEKERFTRTIDLERRYQQDGDEVWHVVGYDLVHGGDIGNAQMQTEWSEGKKLWKKSKFVVVKRKGYAFNEKDLPPNNIVIDTEIEGSSTLIRESRFSHQPIDQYVTKEVDEYIQRYGLYRGRPASNQAFYSNENPRLLIEVDEKNNQAVELAQKLSRFSCPENPNLIVDIGGDGHRLRAIKKLWPLRLPFFGINAGHRGYLLNDMKVDDDFFPLKNLVLHHLPLLNVEMLSTDGHLKSALAFNEVWVEREYGQSVWLEMMWNQKYRIPKVVGDGILISTAAGSTGYARNICRFTLPPYTKELLVIGMGIDEPASWKDQIFSQTSLFEITALDVTKRPVRVFIDGIAQGTMQKIKIETSKIASVELAFVKGFDIVEKHTRLQLSYFESI